MRIGIGMPNSQPSPYFIGVLLSMRASVQNASRVRVTRARDRVLDDQNDDGADDCDEQAPEVEAVHASCTDETEEKATYDCPDNSQDDIEEHSFTGLVDELAGDEARNQT